MNKTDVELVCFDLGHVLIRIAEGWEAACGAAGVPEAAGALTEATRQQVRAAVMASEAGQISQATFQQRVGTLLGIAPEHVRCISESWLCGPYPGAMELLEQLLQRADVKTACLSNTNECHWELVLDPQCEQYLRLDRMDFQFASHLVGVRKPDEAIYVHVEQVTGVAADRILFFDNLADNVEAAARRGWQAHWIDQTKDPVPQVRAQLAACGLVEAPVA